MEWCEELFDGLNDESNDVTDKDINSHSILLDNRCDFVQKNIHYINDDEWYLRKNLERFNAKCRLGHYLDPREEDGNS